MNKILIIEDDSSLRSFMRVLLSAQEYTVIEALDGKQGITLALTQQPEIILVDLGLPDIDGLDVIQQIHDHVNGTIIVVSARDKENDKITALDNGADDYLTKPFNAQELLARIRVGLRHNQSSGKEVQDKIMISDLFIDFEKHVVSVNEQEIHLTPIEFEILGLLARNHGKVLTHHYILKNIWGEHNLESDIQTLRVTMANLRRKIEQSPSQPKYILTEIGIGYRFIDS